MKFTLLTAVAVLGLSFGAVAGGKECEKDKACAKTKELAAKECTAGKKACCVKETAKKVRLTPRQIS